MAGGGCLGVEKNWTLKGPTGRKSQCSPAPSGAGAVSPAIRRAAVLARAASASGAKRRRVEILYPTAASTRALQEKHCWWLAHGVHMQSRERGRVVPAIALGCCARAAAWARQRRHL